MGTKLEKIIKGMHVIDSNLQYIAKTGRINGSLYISIQQAMKEYATECVKASLEKAGERAVVYFDEESGAYDGWFDKECVTSQDNIILL